MAFAKNRNSVLDTSGQQLPITADYNRKPIRFQPLSQSSELKAACGSFAYRELGRQGLLDIAQCALLQEPIQRQQALQLAKTPLPFLAKLIELHRISEPPTEAVNLCHPVVYFPLAETIEKRGESAAIDSAAKFLCSLQINHAGLANLQLVIDRWNGNFSIETLVSTLDEIVNCDSLPFKLSTLGPSTKEVKAAISSNPSSPALMISETEFLSFFHLLKQAGVKAIEGGCDLTVMELATEIGFAISVGQRLLPFKTGPNCSNLTSFLDTLFALRRPNIASEFGHSWFPVPGITQSPCESLKAANQVPTRLKTLIPISQLLNCTAIARLVLVEFAKIRAPVSIFGCSGAKTARLFGANDWGFLAVNEQSSQSLGIPQWEAPQ